MKARRKKRFHEPKRGDNLKIVETLTEVRRIPTLVVALDAPPPVVVIKDLSGPRVVATDLTPAANADSPVDVDADSSATTKADSPADVDAGSSATTKADSSADVEADSTAHPEPDLEGQSRLNLSKFLSAISSVAFVLTWLSFLAGSVTNGMYMDHPPWRRPQPIPKQFSVAELKSVALAELKNHRVPLIVLACIFASPKLLWLWGCSIFLKRPAAFLFHKMPAPLQEHAKSLIPDNVRGADWLHELNEGMEQSLPFANILCFLFCPPFAIVWMLRLWCERLFWPGKDKGFIHEAERIDFTQNRDRSQDNVEDNFIHSPAFTITALTLTALGIPAAICFILYQTLGIDRLLGVPVEHLFFPIAWRSEPGHIGSIPVSIVWYLYLFGWGSAMATLFLRAWFTFPSNFLSDEHRIELTPNGIRRHSIKGWFLYVITLNRPSAGADSLKWKDVKSIKFQENCGARLYPLPEGGFSRNSLIYRVMNKVAAVFDGFSEKLESRKYILISEGETAWSRSVPINLADLNAQQRILLFHQVRHWAPTAVIDRKAQEQLVGSTVLQDDVRYTQIWFDVLSSRNKASRTSKLESGEQLLSGEWTVIDRLGTGGQATAYLARRRDGTTCVLKEFILSQAESSGALLESAREFEAEASLLSQLTHDRIVKLIDFFSEDGRVYVVLEHIEGQTLRQLVKTNGPLDQAQVVRIALEVCDILGYLHGLTPAMVHRDLTPENIIVQADGSIKLIDFSLAIRHKEKTMTASVGKNCFTPPEQFRDQSCPQSDIYALGATMHYALTGAMPKPLTRSSPRECKSEISDALNAVVERATELDLAKRYESADWLRLELEACRSTSQ